MSQCVGLRIFNGPTWHIIGNFGDETFQEIDCTGSFGVTMEAEAGMTIYTSAEASFHSGPVGNTTALVLIKIIK